MSNAITLPEPDGSAEANQRPHPGGGYEYDEVPAWSEPLVHAHAAAVTAAKDAEIAQLRADNTRLQNDVVMPLRERVRVLEDALKAANYRTMVDARISYRGYSYGMGSTNGITDLRRAIERDGNG